jgi:hypothetical protein
MTDNIKEAMMKVGAVSGAMWEGLNKNKRN